MKTGMGLIFSLVAVVGVGYLIMNSTRQPQPSMATPSPSPQPTITTEVTPQPDMQEPQHPLIRLDYPEPNSVISSPLQITGEARGQWFFEATFPVVLTNWDGEIIAQGQATAEGEWMTEEFVPFSASLDFPSPEYGDRGALILQRANASGLPQNDDALEITIFFE